MPASTALVPETVSLQNLQSANALLGLTRAATMIAGPALAGVLVATASPGAALAVHAACYLVSAAFLIPMRTRAAPATIRTGFLRELRDGFTEVRSRRWLWTSILAFTIFTTIAYPAFMIAGPVIAKESLGGPGRGRRSSPRAASARSPAASSRCASGPAGRCSCAGSCA